MKLGVSKELKLPGSVSHAQCTEWWNDVEYPGRTVRFALPVTVDAEYAYDGDGFSVKGKITTAFRSECARCTKEFIEPFETDFDERFEKGAADDGEKEVYPFTGEELALNDLIRDAILLNMPSYSLCSEDCRGLCPICGCDLNTAQCSCRRDEENDDVNPFLKLKTLLNDDKEV